MEYVRVSFVLVCVLVCCTTAGNTRLLLRIRFPIFFRFSILLYSRESLYGDPDPVATRTDMDNSTPPKEWLNEEDRCRTPDGGSGTCINLNDCKIITNFIASSDNLSNDVKGALRKYVCDSRTNVKVCCPSKLPDSWASNKIADHSLHRNIKLLPENCGKSSTSNRITRGNKTSLYEFPWAAALKYDGKNPYSCGASLISDRYVLTAAHCIRSQNKLIGARLGEHDFSTNPDCETLEGQKLCAPPHQDFDISVNDAIVHPEYSPQTPQYDIALIRLRSPANTTVFSVSSVCLPITMPEKTHKFINYTVIGWGATETGLTSPILLKVRVPKVETSTCAPLYEIRTKLTDNQICAGGKNEQDSCTGDSGGPLLADYTADGGFRTLQYGIVSFGPRICGRVDFPTVYTRVDKYVGWILDNIKP